MRGCETGRASTGTCCPASASRGRRRSSSPTSERPPRRRPVVIRLRYAAYQRSASVAVLAERSAARSRDLTSRSLAGRTGGAEFSKPRFDGARRLPDCLRDVIVCHVLELRQDSVARREQFPQKVGLFHDGNLAAGQPLKTARVRRFVRCSYSWSWRTTTGSSSPGRISTTTQVSPWKGTLSPSLSGCGKSCSPITEALPVWERTNTVNLGTAEMLAGVYT